MSRAKSKAEHKRDGTYQPCRHGDKNYVATGSPQEPPWIAVDPVASKLWGLIVEHLPDKGLGAVDALILAGTVRWFLVWQELDKKLVDDPGEYKTLQMAAMAFKQFVVGASKLGLSPSDRARLRLPEGGGGESESEKGRFFSVIGAKQAG